MTLDARLLNFAGYTQGITPGPDANGAYTLAWYSPATGGMRATVYATSPGYVVSAVASPMSNARDFLSVFVGSSPTTFSKRAPAMTAYLAFNTKLGAYQNAVRDYVGAQGTTRWVGPFPQTIASLWRDLLSSYVAAWSVAKGLGIQLLQSQGAANVSTSSIPSTTKVQTATVMPTLAPRQSVVAITPEVTAQIVGTQRVGISPTGTMSHSTAASQSAVSAGGAQVAQQMMTEAGAPLQVGPAGGTLDTYRDPTRTIVHVPLYKEPSFWVAVGAGLLIVGGIGYTLQKKRRSA